MRTKFSAARALSILFAGFCLISLSDAEERSKYEDNIELWNDREWTNADGQTITARVIAMKDDKVTMKIGLSKEVTFPISMLDDNDKAWLKSWSPPAFKTSMSMRDFNDGKPAKREFTIKTQRYSEYSITFLEEQHGDLLRALEEFFRLATKSADGAQDFDKPILRGRFFAAGNESDLVELRVQGGKVYCGGRSLRRRMTAEELVPFYDYLRAFSPSNWVREQERIKSQFE